MRVGVVHHRELGVPVSQGGVAVRARSDIDGGELGASPRARAALVGPPGLIAVGAAVGSVQYMEEAGRTVCASAARFLNIIATCVDDPQIAFLLVRHCAITRMTYLQRCTCIGIFNISF